jgi:selenocysteine lyase/cysteine desulfurase
MSRYQDYFSKYRRNIVGIDQEYSTPFGKKKIIYCDWIASGRLYKPIERRMSDTFGPFVANTHTETSETGSVMGISPCPGGNKETCQCRT